MSKRGEALPEDSPKVQLATSLLTSYWAALLGGGIVVLAVLAAYHGSFSVPFLFDDLDSILENATIRHLWPPGAALSPPRTGTTVMGRPLVNLSLAVNYAFGGEAVIGYHVFNLAVHILASLILFGIVRRTLLLDPGLRGRFGAAALPLALAVALLWALHPLQTESVTYVVQRAESLMGLFYLLTLYGFIRGTQSLAVGWYALSIAACFLGMATKEVMVSAPLLVWLYDRTFVAGTFVGALRARWRVYAGLGSSWLLLAYLESTAGGLGSAGAGFHTEVKWWSYACIQFWAIVHYLRLSVWPWQLMFDYGDYVTQMVVRAVQAQLLPSALVVAALVAGTVLSLRRWPAVGFLGCWFFCILAPTSSVLPLLGQTVAEHRMYLPLAAVVTLLVLGVYSWVGRRSFGLFLAFAVGLAVLTSRRNEDYRSAEIIWRDTLTKHASNWRAHNNLGIVLAKQGKLDEAIQHYEQALQLSPDYGEALCNLGSALAKQGRSQEAIQHYKRALQINPDFANAHNNLGNALAKQGKFEEAIRHYERVLQIKPDHVEARTNLATALAIEGKVPEAIQHFQRALELATEQQKTEMAETIRAQIGFYQSALPQAPATGSLVP